MAYTFTDAVTGKEMTIEGKHVIVPYFTGDYEWSERVQGMVPVLGEMKLTPQEFERHRKKEALTYGKV